MPSSVTPIHSALGPATGAAGAPVAEARLTDQGRVAVLLQAAALLSHLEHAGWHLPEGWTGSRISAEGNLVGVAAGPGRSRPAQELLRDLAGRLFGGAAVSGRGEARRSVRSLLDAWRQSLVPLSPDRAVAQILEAVPFLWAPAFAGSRRALAGEHRGAVRTHRWAAGPGPSRSRLLARAPDLPALQELLAGVEARSLWDGASDRPPGELAAAGRHREAVAAWERRPPGSAAERLDLGRCLARLGRFERALEAIGGGDAGGAALALRARCQLALGRLAAARGTLRRLAEAELGAEETLDVAEIAARVFANAHDPAQAARWVDRALAAAPGPLAPRARVLAATAAWDRGDLAAMDRFLEEAGTSLSDPDLAWRWHQAKGLRAIAAGEGREAAGHQARALRLGRRGLSGYEVAGLWNDLGISRTQSGDLGGAERAFLHAQRLLAGCDGPRKTTLALHNLAEVRLRRGRTAGVREILERSTAENRLGGNLRGLAHDLDLWARFELVQGRPAAALALCRGALAELDAKGLDWHRAELHVLAARALGWMGRPAEAVAELAATTARARAELEPEELPALWAHAGDRAAALEAAAGRPFAALFAGALGGEDPPEPAWAALDGLEGYRAARLIYDLERLAPGYAPPGRVRAAAGTLRRVGATAFAEALEGRDRGPWRALAAYLDSVDGTAPDPEAIAALFSAAGFPEALLSWEIDADRRPLAGGAGGAQEVAALCGEARLVLSAPRLDDVLLALFAVVRRDLPPPAAPAPVAAGSGLVGESPALAAALDRTARFAPGDLPVLVLGESGTGKELVARRIHRGSPRSRAPFVAVNCAALAESLLLSDLFGHVRGAFTGADRERAGVFETAQGGTVFLDEIGDLPLVAQGMLLRVLQEGEVRRLGESLPRRVQVRVVAATHRDLARRVAEGTFRQDLYFRLKVASVELPPLRDRGRDVLLLADHFLAQLGNAPGRPSRSEAPRLSREARARLLAHRWPGNVRELQNVLAAAAALAMDGAIEPSHLDLPEPAAGASTDAAPPQYHSGVEALRRRLVAEALAAAGGNRAEAARRLGVSRQALSYLVRQLGLL